MTGQATVTATIPSYAGGYVIAYFQSNGGGSPLVTSTSAALDSSGTFTLLAWQNSAAIYAPSQTTFIIGVGNNPTTTFSVTTTITSTSQNISSLFDGAPTPNEVDATSINGVTITGTPSAGYVPVAIDATTATWQDSGGSDIPYPGAGIPVSTGSAWDDSLSLSGTGDVLTSDSDSATGSITLGGIIALDLDAGTITATSFTGAVVGNASTATSATSATTSTNISGGVDGSLPYQSAANTTALLAPNTTATKKFLVETGTGSAGQPPTWSTITSADVPTLNQNTSGNAATATLATTATTAVSAGQLNGSNVPASAVILGTNSSSQLIGATVTGTGTTAVLSVSPALTGTPTVPTAATTTNTTQAASTAFVQAQIAVQASTLGGTLGNGNASLGTGAGTGGSVALSGSDGNHVLTVTTGTLPTLSGAIASVTFTASRGHITYPVLTPANSATALLSGASMIFVSTNSATSYVITAGSTPLTASTAYAWNVSCP